MVTYILLKLKKMQSIHFLFVVGGDPDLFTDPEEAWNKIGCGQTMISYKLVDGELEQIYRLSCYDSTKYKDFNKKVLILAKMYALRQEMQNMQLKLTQLEKELV
jgi:hypothetical protein